MVRETVDACVFYARAKGPGLVFLTCALLPVQVRRRYRRDTRQQETRRPDIWRLHIQGCP